MVPDEWLIGASSAIQPLAFLPYGNGDAMKSKWIICIVIGLAAMCVQVAHAQATLAQIQSEFVSSWLVTIKGQARTLVLRVAAVTQKDGESFALDATFGFIDGKGSQLQAELAQSEKGRQLRFVTQSGNRYVATQAPSGVFEGIFSDVAGITKAVSLEKISENALKVKLEADLRSTPAINKPPADVPPSCASFVGGWTGTWRNGDIPQQWLWVVEVNAACTAQYSYAGSRITQAFNSAQIKQDVFSIPCGNAGTCHFEQHGNQLWATYSNPSGGTNSAVFRKLD
jgi:hypothetical protein